jgi:hypothetical protein
MLAHLGHVGHCSRGETIATAVATALIGFALFRPWRRRMNDTRSAMRTRLLLPLLLAAVITLGGCGGGKQNVAPNNSTSGRPSTPAQVKILEPTASQVTGPDITVRVELVGGRVVDRTAGPLTPDEGHVHLLVDGKTVAMAYQDTQDLTGLPAGPHTLLAEFVAVDHNPFRNRPTASVIFTVAG